MIHAGSAHIIRQALERAKGGAVPDEAITLAIEEVDELLALYAEAEGVDADSMTDAQKIAAATEALHRVLPQYRLWGAEIETEDRGGVGVSVMKLHLEWAMT